MFNNVLIEFKKEIDSKNNQLNNHIYNHYLIYINYNIIMNIL